MPPELSVECVAATRSRAWPGALLRVGAAWFGLILAFAGDWRTMLQQWWDSSTYNHILLVPVIVVWLISLRWPALRRLAPQIWAPGLILVGLAIALWLLGSFGGFSLLRQAGAVAVLPASLVTMLGTRVGMGLLFPLAYMAFLVPFGDELVPTLQLVTAKLTIELVRHSGIPATIDGVFIDTPAGLFEVAEACSGVKFLIAMVALGTLVANVCFRSWRRRLAFLALCVVAPVLANGVRAWGTIFAAQYIGAERAGGVDHIIYGWFFFALVIAGVIGLSWRFFDRAIDDPMIDPAKISSQALPRWLAAGHLPLGMIILLGGAMVWGGKAWASAADALQAPLPNQILLPEVPGWQRVEYVPVVPWQPRAAGAEHRLLGRYADAQGNRVDVFLALYASQSEGREATGFGEGALPQDSEWSWASAGPMVGNAKSDILRARRDIERLTETYYRNGTLLTGNALQLKFATIADRLALRREPTVLLILSTEGPASARPGHTLERFRAATGPVGSWMDRIVALR